MASMEKRAGVGKTTLSPEELKKISASFEGKPPQEVLIWALDKFHPRIALACSFGAEDVALVDMVIKIRPDARILYLDTGLLFPETYQVRERIAARYNIKPERYAAALSLEEQAKNYGDRLWEQGPDLCCKLRKIQPMEEALRGLDAWITGLRRDQAPSRANAGVVEHDHKFNLVKINPLASWKWKQVWEYIWAHDVPYNPLHDQGYPSIGCVPCTRLVKPGADPRSGRWAGFQKTECGLHQ